MEARWLQQVLDRKPGIRNIAQSISSGKLSQLLSQKVLLKWSSMKHSTVSNSGNATEKEKTLSRGKMERRENRLRSRSRKAGSSERGRRCRKTGVSARGKTLENWVSGTREDAGKRKSVVQVEVERLGPGTRVDAGHQKSMTSVENRDPVRK